MARWTWCGGSRATPTSRRCPPGRGSRASTGWCRSWRTPSATCSFGTRTGRSRSSTPSTAASPGVAGRSGPAGGHQHQGGSGRVPPGAPRTRRRAGARSRAGPLVQGPAGPRGRAVGREHRAGRLRGVGQRRRPGPRAGPGAAAGHPRHGHPDRLIVPTGADGTSGSPAQAGPFSCRRTSTIAARRPSRGDEVAWVGLVRTCARVRP